MFFFKVHKGTYFCLCLGPIQHLDALLITIISHGFGAHVCTVPMVMHPWMTGMCKQSTLNGAFPRCQAQWSPLLNAREKGHSSPNCSTKLELPGLYLAWLASVTGNAASEVKKKKRSMVKNNNVHEKKWKWKGDSCETISVSKKTILFPV